MIDTQKTENRTQSLFTGSKVKAHQRLIREKRERENLDADLFGRWWEDLDISRENADVREVDYKTAESVILDYEWLGTMPSGMKIAIGLYFDGAIAAVECFTDSKAGSMYSFNNEPAICLARGACVHWAPKWAASYLIPRAVKMIDAEAYHYVIAYSDTDAGEIGTVYQACNWICTGAVKNVFWGSPDGRRYDQRHHRDLAKERVDGKMKVVDQKHLQVKEQLLADGWQYKEGGTRFRYVFALGTGREAKARRKRLAKFARPYPKRGY